MADSNKTEKPTGRRLQRARSEGQFVASRDMLTAGHFLVFVIMLGAFFPVWFDGMKAMLRDFLAAAFHGELDIARAPGIARALIDRAFLPLAGVAFAAVVTSLAVQLSITRMGFTFKKFLPDFGRFNPANKIRQIATQAPVALLQTTAMLVVFSTTIYYVAKENAGIFLSLPFASLEVGISTIAASLKELLWKATAVFIVFGVIDFVRQRRRYMEGLKMTKQEVKDEVKDMEGNPHVRGKIRRLRRDLARRRMMKAVPAATAVIVNPTHYAVALKYEHTTMATPVVVAKGRDFLALRIRQLAIENQVPLVENPPLAQALYKSVEVGREIPANLYRAVAEVLAYIHRLRNLRPGKGRRAR
ncbi:MAG TPA: EscU/YscU/HrcU family type III secretion system export apparatus switch protein [Bryobacteraceae bacterium]|nr:EscU/YscU/HrcU family type III secretion system export apparatus switch protein [Bryobacteraceae bacterium]